MAVRLTDAERGQILEEYRACGSYSAVGRAHGVYPSTVMRIVDAAHRGRRDAADAGRRQPEANPDMPAYMDSKLGEAQLLVDACMAELLKPQRLQGARFSEITAAMKMVLDKFAVKREPDEDALAKLDQIIAGMDDAAER